MADSDTAFADETRFVAALGSDPLAFIALYDLYFPRVYNYVRYRCTDPATADDLTAQIFEQALRKIGTFNPKRAPFGAWLFGIAAHVVTRHWRSLKGNRIAPLEAVGSNPGSDPTPEENFIQAETCREMLAAVRRLDERERDLLGLKFAARLTNRHIAAITGLRESNVGVILYRAIQKLRRELSARDTDYG
jgi:RNA polymerase sigma factor (sigma-70 family)